MCIQKLIFSQCLMTACGMISFGGLLSEQLPCQFQRQCLWWHFLCLLSTAPSPVHSLSAVNFPAVIHSLKLSLNCHYFGYFDMPPYIYYKLHLSLRPGYDLYAFVFFNDDKLNHWSRRQQYQANILIISVVKKSQHCAQIFSATSQQGCICVLHICLRQLFFSENILLYQI